MKFSRSILMIILLISNSTAFTQWVFQESGTSQWLRAVRALTDSIVITVGDRRTILISHNGGKVWKVKDAGENYHLTAVEATVDSTFFISGVAGPHPNDHGIIIKSTDLGETWKYIYFDSLFGIDDIAFLSSSLGWSISNNYPISVIKKTIDGGQTWSEQLRTNNLWFNSIFFSDTLNGWITGSSLPAESSKNFPSLVFRTSNGGITWENFSPEKEVPIRSTFFLTSSMGWICGDSGLILKTNNAGQTWEQQLNISYLNFNDVQFVDPLNGWVVGNRAGIFHAAVILRTTDGGNNWSIHYVPDTDILFSIYFVNSLVGWAVGVADIDSFDDKGIILKTTNGGITFIKENQTTLPTTITLNAFPNPFNAQATINYMLPQAVNVRVKVYNMIGNEVVTLVNKWSPPGTYSIIWDAANQPSGVYIIKLSTEDFVTSQKVLLMK